MSDALLHDDIRSWLRSHAGRERAAPRSVLLAHLRSLGHSIDDRGMRKAYADMERVGSCARGLFWIVDAEDRRVAERSLHSRAMAELVREKRVKDAVPAGQLGLWAVLPDAKEKP